MNSYWVFYGMLVLGGPFIIYGGWSWLSLIKYRKRIPSLIPVDAMVMRLDSMQKHSQDLDISTILVDMSYRYEYEDKVYTNGTLTIQDMYGVKKHSQWKVCEKEVFEHIKDAYEGNSVLKIYIDPKEPEFSVISKKKFYSNDAALVICLLLVLGVFLFISE